MTRVSKDTGTDASGAQGELLSDRAYSIIEEWIVTLQLQPRAVLSESKLALQIGIGRTPVREALQRLAREGLVHFMPSRGVTVSDIDANSQIRLLEVRRSLEGLVVSLAAERATSDQRQALREVAVKFRSVESKEQEIDFMRSDLLFNMLILQAAHNQYCDATMAAIQGLSRRFFFRYKDYVNLRETATLHAEIAENIVESDASGAKEALNKLIDHNMAFATRSLSLP